MLEKQQELDEKIEPEVLVTVPKDETPTPETKPTVTSISEESKLSLAKEVKILENPFHSRKFRE